MRLSFAAIRRLTSLAERQKWANGPSPPLACTAGGRCSLPELLRLDLVVQGSPVAATARRSYTVDCKNFGSLAVQLCCGESKGGGSSVAVRVFLLCTEWSMACM